MERNRGVQLKRLLKRQLNRMQPAVGATRAGNAPGETPNQHMGAPSPASGMKTIRIETSTNFIE